MADFQQCTLFTQAQNRTLFGRIADVEQQMVGFVGRIDELSHELSYLRASLRWTLALMRNNVSTIDGALHPRGDPRDLTRDPRDRSRSRGRR